MNRWILTGLVVFSVGCTPSAPAPTTPAPRSSAAPASVPSLEQAVTSEPLEAASPIRPLPDAMSAAVKMQATELPSSDFRSGEVTSMDMDEGVVKQTADGFVIQMPSGTPIPTPTLYDGKLYVSGGFSSSSFHCFEADTGRPVWSAGLSDDGPSQAVPYEGDIYLNTESCTLFVLDAKTGKRRWAHYLGDPMMSAPAVANGRVFTVYAAAGMASAPESDDVDEHVVAGLEPSYNLGCFDAKTGALIWRRWLDGDCITAPVVEDADLFIATMPGTYYRFRAHDGELIAAQHARATSAPTIAADTVFFTRRVDDRQSDKPSEAIVGISRRDSAPLLLALERTAPYLDHRIQKVSKMTEEAGKFEGSNGFGGFGGGFGGGGNFAVFDEVTLGKPEGEATPADKPFPEIDVEPQVPADKLAEQQLKAADNLGLGNVSTLQGFQGSRIVHHAERNYNVMGDELLCTATTGEKIWSLKLEGDLLALGGHLAAPPVIADSQLFLATVVGQVLVLDLKNGDIRERYPVEGKLRFSPAVWDGRIYVTTQDGKVVCLKRRLQP